MMLMTQANEQMLRLHPLGSQSKKGLQANVIVKYFNPVGAGTWLITEGEPVPNSDDWLLYGYGFITTWEWGFVYLSELKSLRLPFGLSIERDLHVSPTATVESLVR